MGIDEDIIDLVENDALTTISSANNFSDLNSIKSLYLGKHGKVTVWLKKLGDLSEFERPMIGEKINLVKKKIMKALEDRSEVLKRISLTTNLDQESIDITMPSRGQSLGSKHPITKIRHLLEDFFIRLGFSIADGPEVESDFYNFTALNIPKYHPARTSHDTFYFGDGRLLRSHTTTVQVRTMEAITPPIRMICTGRVFRRDSDATHSPMFHQLDMLMVDKNLTFANLRWIIVKFIRYLFGNDVEYRFRPSYFPFTEPSAEVDIKWKLEDSWRWLELGGCGMVHPNVLKAVNLESKRFKGIAFGFGIDRLAMSYYGIDDIRRLFDNDIQFLGQFAGA